MYLLISFELSEKDYRNKTHEKIYKLLEDKFGFKRTWENNELPINTMIGKFTGVEPYMQIYGKIKDELKRNKIKVEKLFICEMASKRAFVGSF